MTIATVRSTYLATVSLWINSFYVDFCCDYIVCYALHGTAPSCRQTFVHGLYIDSARKLAFARLQIKTGFVHRFYFLWVGDSSPKRRTWISLVTVPQSLKIHLSHSYLKLIAGYLTQKSNSTSSVKAISYLYLWLLWPELRVWVFRVWLGSYISIRQGA